VAGIISAVSSATCVRFASCRSGRDTLRRGFSVWLTGLRETVEQLPAFVQVAAEIGVKEVYLQRLVFFAESAIGKAQPDQALFERLTQEEAVY